MLLEEKYQRAEKLEIEVSQKVFSMTVCARYGLPRVIFIGEARASTEGRFEAAHNRSTCVLAISFEARSDIVCTR
jgi:hypothetical protein